MKKVILVCTYGHRNSGDDAQGLSTAYRLREALPETEISVAINHASDHDEIAGCTRNPLIYLVVQLIIPEKSRMTSRIYRALGFLGIICEYLSKRFRLWCLLAQGWLYAKTGLICSFKKSVRQILETIRSGDLLYVGGGANCNDIWLWDGLVSRMSVVRIFHYFGKPVVMSGQGVGPLRSRFSRKFTKKSLRYVDMITLRDPETSESLLREIGVRAPKLMSVGDDAVGLEPASKEQAEELIRNAGFDPSEEIMGVQVRFATYHHRREMLEYCVPTASILDHMIETFGVKILFFPSAFYASGGWDDRDVAYRVLRNMRHCGQAAVVHEEFGPAVCKALVGCFHMFLGTAYHPCVFALAAGVPVVSLYEGPYYKNKLGGAFGFYGLENNMVEYSKATPEKIEMLFEPLLADRQSFKNMTSKVASKLRQDIDITITRAVELLEENDARKL